VLQPDVLVKGGDYRNKKDVVGWEIVEAYGGEVQVMGVVENLSTTAIVSKIQGESKD
jgi:D-beta-D-heptose 7-phosphate kinase/D-beta-D-heptose 1-phosphate adenosyltransferase